MTIRFAEIEAEREAIYRLRYTIYVEELGAVAAPEVDHERRWLSEGSVRNSRLLYAELGGEVVATLRLQLGTDDALTEDDATIYAFSRFAGHVGLDQVCVLSRFMALPDHRGGLIPQLMLQAMYRFCVAHRLAICFLDCRPHLLNLYQRLGYRSYGRPYNDPAYGLLIPMALLIADRAYLQAVGSPFAEDAPHTSIGTHPEVLAALLRDEQPAVHSSASLHPDMTSAYVSGLADQGCPPVGLFQGFTEAEAAQVLAGGHIVTCRRGDKLLVNGDVEHSMFLILRGHVEACVGERVVAVEGPGSVIGEVAYLLRRPRTADVVAAEDDVRVLYLRHQTIEALMRDEPHLAVRFLLNLNRVTTTKLLAKYR